VRESLAVTTNRADLDESPVESAVRYRRYRRLAVVVAALLCAAFACAVLEGAAWAHQYYKLGGFASYQPRHLYDFHRFYRVNTVYRSRTVRVNRAGFRNDEEITLDKPPGVIRIAVMGGSTVWGEDAAAPYTEVIDNQETIPAHLERILNARVGGLGMGIRVQVLNAGVVGYLAFQELIHFDHHVSEFKPDLVIVMDGHNDLDALQGATPPYRHQNEESVDRGLNRPTLADLAKHIVKYIEDRSLFVRKASLRLNEPFNRFVRRSGNGSGEVAAKDIDRWLDHYETTVRRFDAAAKIVGARILFTVQPELLGDQRKPLSAEEVERRRHWAGYAWLHTGVRDRLIARMQDVALRHGLWFADVSDVFADEPAHAYLDYAHLTNRGAEVVATRLAGLVEPTILSRAASR
jgi:lysophospholipase L1-like esterase